MLTTYKYVDTIYAIEHIIEMERSEESTCIGHFNSESEVYAECKGYGWSRERVADMSGTRCGHGESLEIIECSDHLFVYYQK